MRLFHYTSLFHLPQILEDGYLKVTESNASMTKLHAAADVVWLTNNPSSGTEESLNGATFSKKQVRFELNVPAIRYRQWAKNHNVSPKLVQRLNYTGGGQANNWYVIERLIAKEEWSRIDIFVPETQQWVCFYNKYESEELQTQRAIKLAPYVAALKEQRKQIMDNCIIVDGNQYVEEQQAS